MRALLAVVSLLLAPAGAEAALSVAYDSGTGELTVREPLGPPVDEVNHVAITLSGNTITVADTGGADPAAGTGCALAGNHSVTCSAALSPAPYATVDLDLGNDELALDGIRGASVFGKEGNDTLNGSGLNDTLSGDLGNDIINGNGGPDLIYGGDDNDTIDGGAGGDAIEGGNGADAVVDTGGGNDTFSYVNEITDPAGVEVTLDGVADDGNVNQDGGADNIGAGIDAVQGSNFADDLVGGGGSDYLTGAKGNDRLVGNAGADTFNGGEGDDRVEARDGAADTDIDCDNQSDPTPGYTPGTADVAVLDAGDPTPRGCETVDRAAAAPGGGSSGEGGSGSFAVVQVKAIETDERGKMPNIVGRTMTAARRAVLAVAAGVDLDVVFQKGCKDAQDLEVIRQRPAKGTTVRSYEGSDVPVRMYVCLAERDFLADCDYSSLKDDLKQLPKQGDAELNTVVLDRFGKCKTDYDIKLAKAAEEARIELEAQREADRLREEHAKQQAIADARKKRAGDIKAGITCPTSPEDQDLRMMLTEGYNPSNETRFGLHASGGPDGWTLPMSPSGQFTSYIDVQITDRAGRLVRADVLVDAGDVGITTTGFGTEATRGSYEAKTGIVRMLFSPRKTGTIRLCAILPTGDDQVLSAGVAIRVVGPLKLGDVWETISGRRIELRNGGPVEFGSRRALARAAGLDEIWGFLVSLFGNTSKTINQTNSENSVSYAAKVRKVSHLWSAAQVTLDGRLDSDPHLPTVGESDCFRALPKGDVADLKCPVMQTVGNTALLGMSTTGTPMVAAGAGNVIKPDPSRMVAAGAGNLLEHNGVAVSAGLIGLDGGTLIGLDGASLIGLDGASIVAAGAGNAIGPASAQMVAAGAGNMVAAGGGNIVAAGGLN